MKAPLRNPVLGLAAALIVAALLPLFTGSLDPYFMDVAVGVGINLILAVSLNLVNGHAGQFSLGHAGFMAVGAYAASWITLNAPASLLGETAPPAIQQLSFLGALLAGGLCAALAGALVAAPSIRLQGDYLALLTLGFGEIVRVLLQNCEPLGGALGLIGMPALTNLSWTFGAAALAIYTVHVMTRSTLGLGFHAVRSDEIAARSVGLDTTRLKLAAFVVGAFYAGVAGALFAHFKLAIDPRGFDFTRSVEIVIMVILGGMGSTRGVACAAILLTLLPEVLRPVAEYRMVLYALILVLLMLLRPQGLLGERKPLAPPPRQ